MMIIVVAAADVNIIWRRFCRLFNKYIGWFVVIFGWTKYIVIVWYKGRMRYFRWCTMMWLLMRFMQEHIIRIVFGGMSMMRIMIMGTGLWIRYFWK